MIPGTRYANRDREPNLEVRGYGVYGELLCSMLKLRTACHVLSKA